MTMPDQFWCRVCRNKKPVAGKCDSCGTNRTKWYEPKKLNPCPRCRGLHTVATQEGSRICKDCGAEFEPVEFGFAHADPAINAERKERYESNRAGRHKSRD